MKKSDKPIYNYNYLKGEEAYIKCAECGAECLCHDGEYECSVCGNTNVVTLSKDRNGLICNKCRTYEHIVDKRTIKFIRMYYYLDISKITKVEMDPKVKNEIDDFLTSYYEKHTGIYLNSKKFIDDLKKVNIYT